MQRQPDASRSGSAWERPVGLALAAGLAAFVVGTAAETFIIRAVHGDRRELEWLSDSFISAAVAGITYLWLHLEATRSRVLALEREQIAIDEQLRLAAEIQRSLLPAVPERTPGFGWAARMVPAGRIGGDFYDFLQGTADSVLALVVDVSGKGIPAALLLSSLRTHFRAIARDTSDPGSIAERMGAALHEEHGGLPYATAIVARFDRVPAQVEYVNAGHPTGYVLREGSAPLALESGGQPLGLLAGATYATQSVALLPGDVGVLVSDGITEALETGPTTFAQLVGAPEALAGMGRSPALLCERLLEAAAGGPGPAGISGWQDDRTVFVFAVEPGA